MAKPVSTVATHPDVKAITSALLRGDKQIDIARRYGLDKMAISRFKRGPLRKALSKCDPVHVVDIPVHEVDSLRQIKADTGAFVALGSTASLVERKLARYERILTKAENDGDLAAWASVDRGETQAFRLRAELGGELQGQVGTTQINVVMLLPPEAADPGQCIDLSGDSVHVVDTPVNRD